jgi:hypothetical protein
MDRISGVVFDNCVISNGNRGLGIQNRDEGTVDDVLFSNIVLDCHLFSDVWSGKAEPIYVTAYRRANANNKDAGCRFPKGETEGKVLRQLLIKAYLRGRVARRRRPFQIPVKIREASRSRQGHCEAQLLNQ